METGFLKEFVPLLFQLHQQDMQLIIPMSIPLPMEKQEVTLFHFLMEDMEIIQGH
jgi:hypothetical protein